MSMRYGRPTLGRAVSTRMGPRGATRSGCGGRLIIALVMAGIALITYFGSSVFNPVTEENQHVGITQEQEIALGLQAAPEMVQQYGGELRNADAQALLDQVGQRLISTETARRAEYPFEFTVLADDQTVNAFALPGGPTFITTALLQRLETEGQLAGVMGHEVVHVLARHGAERIAKQQLTQGLTGAVVLATYDPDDPSSQRTAQVALLIGQLVNLRYGREDELESDRLGVRIMAEAGYDPRAMVRVMEILAEASGGGGGQPEFFSTHPNPENRIARIEAAIQELYPDGVPEGLIP